MTDILDSVLEDIKQEKVDNAFKRYGKFLIVGIIVFLIVGLMMNWWSSHQRNVIYSEAAEYVKVQFFLNQVKNQQML